LLSGNHSHSSPTTSVRLARSSLENVYFAAMTLNMTAQKINLRRRGMKPLVQNMQTQLSTCMH